MLEPDDIPNPSERARGFHRTALVLDLHCDSIMSERDLLVRSEQGHLDLPRLEEAGVRAQVFAIWSDPNKLRPGEYEPHVVDGVARLKTLCDRAPDRIAPALTPDELAAVTKSDRIAAVLGVEGGHALEGRLDRLERWWQYGVRLLTVTWCNSNELADGGWDEETPHGGLSALGREAVKTMNRLGMLVDVSHCSDKAFFQILDSSSVPVVASHSGVRALCNHPRNLTDEMLRRLAENRGVVGVVFLPAFLSGTEGVATVDHVVNAIDHAVQLIGPDHVGLGSDWDGFGAAPAGLEDVSKLPAVTEGLLRRGYPTDGIEKVLGRSFLRVWQDVYAARLV